MLILSRYLVKHIAFTTFLISLVLTLIIWLTQSLRLLDFIINGGAPIRIFGGILLLTMPKFLEVILPISLALGIVYSMNKFSADSELVVMQNTGVSPLRLGIGIFSLSVFVACIVMALSGWGTPLANRKLDQLKNIVKSEYSFGVLRPGIFNVIGNDTTIYIAERNNLQDLKGVFIHLKKGDASPTTITAQHGGLIMRDQKPYLVVFDGIRQQFNPRTGSVEMLKFERYSVNLSSLATPVTLSSSDPSGLTLSDLLSGKARTIGNGGQKSPFTAEMHERLSKPILTLAFAFLTAVPFLLSYYNRRGHSVRVTLIIVCILVLQSLYLATVSLAGKYAFGVLILYALPLSLIIVLLITLLNYGSGYYFLTPISWLLGGKERLV